LNTFEVYVGSCVGAWLVVHLIILFFHLPSYVLFTTLRIKLGLSHPLVLGVSHYICKQHLNLMEIHFLHYAHGGERMALHDVMRNVFPAIAKNVGFHVSQKQTHVLLLPTLKISMSSS
jgi:hypothetical protein